MRRTFTYVKESLRSILRSENGPSKVRKGDEEEEGGLEKHVLLSQDWKEKRKKFSLRCVWNENHIMERVRRRRKTRKNRQVLWSPDRAKRGGIENRIKSEKARHGSGRKVASLSPSKPVFCLGSHAAHRPSENFSFYLLLFSFYDLSFGFHVFAEASARRRDGFCGSRCRGRRGIKATKGWTPEDARFEVGLVDWNVTVRPTRAES